MWNGSIDGTVIGGLLMSNVEEWLSEGAHYQVANGRVYNKYTHWSAPVDLVKSVMQRSGLPLDEALRILGVNVPPANHSGNLLHVIDLGGR